jgi:hypothetical protein
LLERVGEDVAGGARGELRDRLAHHARERVDVERGRQPDDRDQGGQQRQRRLERERARVAEAVGGAEARDRVEHEAAVAGAPQGLERLIALELLVARDRDG